MNGVRQDQKPTAVQPKPNGAIIEEEKSLIAITGPHKANTRREMDNSIKNLRQNAGELGVSLTELRVKFPELTNHSAAVKNGKDYEIHAAAAKDEAVMIVTLLRANNCKESDLKKTGLVRVDGTVEDDPAKLIGPRLADGKRFDYKNNKGLLEQFHRKYGLIQNVPDSCAIQVLKEGKQLVILLGAFNPPKERPTPPPVPPKEEKFGTEVTFDDATPVKPEVPQLAKGVALGAVSTPNNFMLARNRERPNYIPALLGGFALGAIGGDTNITKCIENICTPLDGSGLSSGSSNVASGGLGGSSASTAATSAAASAGGGNAAATVIQVVGSGSAV